MDLTKNLFRFGFFAALLFAAPRQGHAALALDAAPEAKDIAARLQRARLLLESLDSIQGEAAPSDVDLEKYAWLNWNNWRNWNNWHNWAKAAVPFRNWSKAALPFRNWSKAVIRQPSWGKAVIPRTHYTPPSPTRRVYTPSVVAPRAPVVRAAPSNHPVISISKPATTYKQPVRNGGHPVVAPAAVPHPAPTPLPQLRASHNSAVGKRSPSPVSKANHPIPHPAPTPSLHSGAARPAGSYSPQSAAAAPAEPANGCRLGCAIGTTFTMHKGSAYCVQGGCVMTWNGSTFVPASPQAANSTPAGTQVGSGAVIAAGGHEPNNGQFRQHLYGLAPADFINAISSLFVEPSSGVEDLSPADARLLIERYNNLDASQQTLNPDQLSKLQLQAGEPSGNDNSNADLAPYTDSHSENPSQAVQNPDGENPISPNGRDSLEPDSPGARVPSNQTSPGDDQTHANSNGNTRGSNAPAGSDNSNSNVSLSDHPYLQNTLNPEFKNLGVKQPVMEITNGKEFKNPDGSIDRYTTQDGKWYQTHLSGPGDSVGQKREVEFWAYGPSGGILGDHPDPAHGGGIAVKPVGSDPKAPGQWLPGYPVSR